MSDLDKLIRFVCDLPKAELHLHIEGSLEPEMMMTLAARNGVTLPYADLDALKAAYQFSQLQDFLDVYYQGMAVLQTEDDFFDLTWAYLKRAAADNVLHTEIFFDPQAHVERGVAFSTVINGIDRALKRGEAELGISSQLILCFLRHLSQEAAFEILQTALPYKDKFCGVGLDSTERGNPPQKFESVFAKAREEGLYCVAHAGEEGPADYVRDTLDLLKVQRIDHGNSALDDAELCRRLATEHMPLTVCPLSNLKLCVVDDMAQHPVPKMLKAGLKVTINSDDPAYFGGYVNDNYVALAKACELSVWDFVALAKNSFDAAFINPTQKTALKEKVATVCVDHGFI